MSFWPMAAIVVLIKKIPSLLSSAQSKKKIQKKNINFRYSWVSEFTCQKGILPTALKS